MKDNNNKKRKPSKLAIKLTGAIAGAELAVGAISTPIILAIRQINGAFYVVNVVMLVALFFALVFVVGRLTIRRVEQLNKAVSEVAKGNFDMSVEVKGNDELAELSENFNKMTAELKANAFLSKDFARYVSHEFKTPLSVIRSYAESLQINSQDKETCDYTEVIISETDRLTDMSKSILELCKLDSTTLIEKKDTFSPAAQVRFVLLGTQTKWNEKKITVTPDLDDFEIIGNESLTYRIWQNLIWNAIKFTEENGTVNISLKKQGGSFLFAVTDNGIGISDEDKDKIYNMFFTGDKSHNKEGSGLGLPLTKTIVEKLGGEISFVSERGKGTTFTVRLPI